MVNVCNPTTGSCEVRTGWWLELRDEPGAAVWPEAATRTTAVAAVEVSMAGVFSVGGELHVVGTVATADGSLDAQLWRVSGAGAELGRTRYGKPAPVAEVMRGAAGPGPGGRLLGPECAQASMSGRSSRPWRLPPGIHRHRGGFREAGQLVGACPPW